MTTTKKYLATLTYIRQNISDNLAIDLETRIRRAVTLEDKDAIMDPLLANMSTGGLERTVTNTDSRRRALRALLLCQHVYLSKITQELDLLTIWLQNWPKCTIDKWKGKSESAMQRAIRMYMQLPNADADALVAAAGNHGPVQTNQGLQTRYHDITREEAHFPVEGICYRAVQSWMLASGYVSMQWFLKNGDTTVTGTVTDDNSVASKLLQIFGPGTMTNVSEDAGGPDRARFARGDIVYMYRGRQDGTPKCGGQLGHWMLAEGNGYAYGCNNFTNDDAEGTNGAYARCSIANQIRAMARGRIRPDEKDWHFVRVFKPGDLEAFPAI